MPALFTRLLSNWRLCQFLILAACCGMLAYALYEQFYHWLMPCLMCIYQRMAVIGVGLMAAVGLAIKPKNRRAVWVISGLQALAALGGIYAAGKHTYLQYVPHDATVVCASSLPFPINFDAPGMPAWLASLLRPVGDCSQIDFSLLGLSMPVWVVLACAALVVFIVLLARARFAAFRVTAFRPFN